MLSPDRFNNHLHSLPVDVFYHFGLASTDDLAAMFGDVRFVCMGGSPLRAETFAREIAAELGYPTDVAPLGKTERYSLFKVGPVISVSHGIGMPSMLIVLHEISKMLRYAQCQSVQYIRVGTSGGLGVPPGTVVVANQVVSATLEKTFRQVELGQERHYPMELDATIAEGLLSVAKDLPVVTGTTMGTDDFYEGQARMDGALPPNYDEAKRQQFFQRALAMGVRNIEMEAPALAAFATRAGIPAAVVCVTLLDRLQGDQVTSTPEELAEFSGRAQKLVLRYLKKELEHSE